jgi:hypothetical protein
MKKSLGANVLVFPAPVWCIGSYGTEGKPNLSRCRWACGKSFQSWKIDLAAKLLSNFKYFF